MSVQVEKLEKSMAKLTITVEAAKFDAAVDSAYQKNKGKIALPGFRKGKAPRAMIEKMYGTGVFFEDAANELIPEAYETAAKESELEIVAQPEIEVTQMDKGTDFIFTATVAIKPEVTLGDYKGIEVEKKELPELDDDFAQDVSDFDTLDEYKADVEKKILENKENQIKREQEDQIIEKIIENAQMEIPQQMIAAQTRQMTQEFAQRLQSQGLSLEQYMQFTGLTPQKMMEDLEPQALKRIQSRLVLEAVVAAENIEASDEEIDKELENMASMYQMEIDKLKELIGDDEKKQIGMDLAVQKAVEFVVKEAVEK